MQPLDIKSWLSWGVTTVITLLSVTYFFKRSGRCVKLPPKPKDSVWNIAKQLHSKTTPLYMLQLARELQSVYTLPFFWGFNAFVVADAKVARQILENPRNEKWILAYEFMNHVASGSTFFASEGMRYKHVRKSTMQAFSPDNIQLMTESVKKCLDEWIDKTFHSDETVLDIADAMEHLTVAIIGKVGFNYDISQEEVELGVASLKTCYLEFARKTRKYPQRKFFPWFYSGVRNAKKASKDLRALAKSILTHYRNNPAKEGEAKPILHYILQDDQYQSDEERLRDVIVFFAGGYDTTSYTIVWTLLELAKRPAIQQWLRNELLKCSTDQQRGPCQALKHTIRESMRLHPVAPVGALRVTSADTALPGGEQIPAHSIALILTLAIQRDPKVFVDPDDFIPQRWEKASDEMNLNWLAFGTGRRSCIGQALAQAELHAVLARLCTEYEWTVEEEGGFDYFVTWKTDGTILKARKL